MVYRNDVYIFNFGVNTDNFERAKNSNIPVPCDICDLKHPIIGYIGGIHKWIDFELVKYIAEVFPESSIVFVGPIQTDVSMLSTKKNIYFLNQKEHSLIPFYIKSFDVGIIPYVLADYTIVGRPTKLNEYLIMGKPIVSTNMPELAWFSKQHPGALMIGGNKEEFAGCIIKAFQENNEKLAQERVEIAKRTSWKQTIGQMSKLVESTIAKKRREKELRWSDILLEFYQSTKKTLLSFGAIVFLGYMLLFHTPFIWFLAEPLKLTDVPQKSNVIVVFAGGVGESGKAGQGYEERVQYAVELYKKGYAANLIFSSGSLYAIKETEVMKMLAVSMGVPAEVIVLEDKAHSTFTNVEFTKEILDRKKWNSILLVSSPYHMLRSSLVFRKIGGEIDITYTPIPQSLFYSRDEGVKLRHIRAILHEYLGIVYYWVKGLI